MKESTKRAARLRLVSAKVPEKLKRQVKEAARKGMVSESDVVRAALAEKLGGEA